VGFVVRRYKVIVGASHGVGLVGGPTDQNGWTGPVFPNASSGKDGAGGLPELPADCSNGCLYNIYDDPTENNELSASHPDVLKSILATITALNASVYRPTPVPNDYRCCTVAEGKNGGFLGPFLP
jgi:arylsulfatase B